MDRFRWCFLTPIIDKTLIGCQQVVIRKQLPRRAAKAFWENMKEEKKKKRACTKCKEMCNWMSRERLSSHYCQAGKFCAYREVQKHLWVVLLFKHGCLECQGKMKMSCLTLCWSPKCSHITTKMPGKWVLSFPACQREGVNNAIATQVGPHGSYRCCACRQPWCL